VQHLSLFKFSNISKIKLVEFTIFHYGVLMSDGIHLYFNHEMQNFLHLNHCRFCSTLPIFRPSTTLHSAPMFPYPGLNKQQIKKLHAGFTKMGTAVDNLRELLSMAGVEMAKQEVVALVAKWAHKEPDVQMFSKLTAHDFICLCESIENNIFINNEHLELAIPDSLIPPEFLRMLHITRMVSSRNTEMGARGVINVFLTMAVYIARTLFEDRLVIHHGWNASPVEILGIGTVGGPLDYITSRAAGNIDMSIGLRAIHTNI